MKKRPAKKTTRKSATKPRSSQQATADQRAALAQLLADAADVEQGEARADAWERRARTETTARQLAEKAFGPQRPEDPAPPAVQDAAPDPAKLKQAAEFMLSEHSIAAVTVKMWGATQFGDSDQTTLAKGLLDEVKNVRAGDMNGPEALLVTQANALNAVFHALMMKALKNRRNFEWFKVVMPLALKAQNQSRMTLETLAVLKNPPQAIFPRGQFNIAGGPQQVNNGAAPAAPPPAVNSSIVDPGKISARAPARITDERGTHATLDPGATATPGRENSEMAAVGVVDRPENRRGKKRK
jgi:hypothetical protein